MDHRERNDARSADDDLLPQQSDELDLASMDFSEDLASSEGFDGLVEATPVQAEAIEAEIIEAELSPAQTSVPSQVVEASAEAFDDEAEN